MQIYQEPQIKGSLQDAFGTGLQQLMQIKVQQMQKRHQQEQAAKAYEKGGKPAWWAFEDPAVQKELIKQQTQTQQANDFASLMGQNTQQGNQDITQLQPQEQLQQMLGSNQGQNQGQINLEKALSSLGPIAGTQQQPMQQQVQQQQMQQPQQRQLDFDRILSNPNLKPDQRLRIEAMKLQKEATEEKGIANKFKETKEFRKATIENARSARDRLHDLEQLEDLEKTGKLDTPGYIEFLKRSGLDISALKSDESAVFEKATAGFIKDARAMFGARVSNFELEQFLKSIPTLSQSPEGRKRVIANLKRVARATVEYANAMKNIIAKNKGVPPYDLMEQVDDEVEKKMDSISKQFKEDIAKPVPAGQNRIITAVQAILGSAAGLPGALANKVGGIGAGLLGGELL